MKHEKEIVNYENLEYQIDAMSWEEIKERERSAAKKQIIWFHN